MDVRVVIDAYQLDRYLRREGWPMEPGNIIRMYQQVILKPSLKKHKDDIATVDSAINAEASFRKERLPEGEFAIWQQNEYPALRWMRAVDLAASGSNPVNGMAEMLKVIKDHPGDPCITEWIKHCASSWLHHCQTLPPRQSLLDSQPNFVTSFVMSQTVAICWSWPHGCRPWPVVSRDCGYAVTAVYDVNREVASALAAELGAKGFRRARRCHRSCRCDLHRRYQ